MRRSLLASFSLICALLCVTVTSPAPATPAQVSAGVDVRSALVELTGDPLATSPRTHPAKGKKVDFTSATVKSERARLSAIRNDFKQWLQKNAPKATVTNEFDVSVHAVSVKLSGPSASFTSLSRSRR